MPATRTYQITADDLKRLHGFAQDSIGTLVCGEPECENCFEQENNVKKFEEVVAAYEEMQRCGQGANA